MQRRVILPIAALGLALASCSPDASGGNVASNITTTATDATMASSPAPAAGPDPNAAPDAAPAPAQHRGLFSGHLSMDKYNKIATGMTYEQVVGIIGKEGKEQASAGEGEFEAKSYMWENFGGGSLIVAFQNDAEVTKAQSGLY